MNPTSGQRCRQRLGRRRRRHRNAQTKGAAGSTNCRHRVWHHPGITLLRHPIAHSPLVTPNSFGSQFTNPVQYLFV
jgi:hypothetical protein